MEKQKWIDEVIGSTEGMQRAEAPAFLTEKIMNRIESGKINENAARSGMRDWALAGFAVVLVLLNVFVLQRGFSSDKADRSETSEAFNNSVTYTY